MSQPDRKQVILKAYGKYRSPNQLSTTYTVLIGFGDVLDLVKCLVANLALVLAVGFNKMTALSGTFVRVYHTASASLFVRGELPAINIVGRPPRITQRATDVTEDYLTEEEKNSRVNYLFE
jgi:hypothetical protein